MTRTADREPDHEPLAVSSAPHFAVRSVENVLGNGSSRRQVETSPSERPWNFYVGGVQCCEVYRPLEVV